MHKFITSLSIILLASQILTPALDARGGGHHGGGHHGGHHGHHARHHHRHRSPSMSRSAHHKGAHRHQHDHAHRGEHRNHDRSANRDHFHNFAHNHPVANNAGHRDDRRANRHDRGRHARDDIGRRHDGYHHWFGHDFWDHHGYHPNYYGGNANWWGVAGAAGIGAWLGWNAAPSYYGYAGDSWGPVQPETNVTVNNASASTKQPQAAVDNGSNGEWMPLGTFALSQDKEDAATPSSYVQLALAKDGTISGTLYNATTDKPYEIEGSVDKDSQRAMWKVADDQDAPTMETGLYNLTEAEAPVRLYFPGGKTQDMLLVHLSGEEKKG